MLLNSLTFVREGVKIYNFFGILVWVFKNVAKAGKGDAGGGSKV